MPANIESPKLMKNIIYQTDQLARYFTQNQVLVGSGFTNLSDHYQLVAS
jgi:hypothetical protein